MLFPSLFLGGPTPIYDLPLARFLVVYLAEVLLDLLTYGFRRPTISGSDPEYLRVI
jgi:hypothetical protein